MRVRRSLFRMMGWKRWRIFGLAALTSCASAGDPVLIAPRIEIPQTLREPCPLSSRPEIPAGLDAPAEPTREELLAAYQARGAFVSTLLGFTLALEADAAECEITKDAAVALLNDVGAAADAAGATPASLRGRIE